MASRCAPQTASPGSMGRCNSNRTNIAWLRLFIVAILLSVVMADMLTFRGLHDRHAETQQARPHKHRPLRHHDGIGSGQKVQVRKRQQKDSKAMMQSNSTQPQVQAQEQSQALPRPVQSSKKMPRTNLIAKVNTESLPEPKRTQVIQGLKWQRQRLEFQQNQKAKALIHGKEAIARDLEVSCVSKKLGMIQNSNFSLLKNSYLLYLRVVHLLFLDDIYNYCGGGRTSTRHG